MVTKLHQFFRPHLPFFFSDLLLINLYEFFSALSLHLLACFTTLWAGAKPREREWKSWWQRNYKMMRMEIRRKVEKGAGGYSTSVSCQVCEVHTTTNYLKSLHPNQQHKPLTVLPYNNHQIIPEQMKDTKKKT